VNKLRAFDSVAGGLTGAAVGGLAGYVLHKLLSPNKEKSGLKAALIGAAAGTGLGVLAGNFAGDLGRRYISNNTIPRDYSRESIKTLKPTSFEQVWDTSINDKPNPAVFNDDYIEAHAKQTGSRNDRETALNTIMARRELFRRGLGVNSDKDTIFKVNQDGSLRFSSDRTPMQPKNIIPRLIWIRRIETLLI
jgi:hypothetical protein